MQLLLLLMLALAGGNPENLKDVRPLIESLGGGDTLRAIEKAEKLSEMISNGSGGLAAGKSGGKRANAGGNSGNGGNGCGNKRGGLKDINCGGRVNGGFECYDSPLAPVARIADGEITSRLSRYIALGE